MQQKYDGLRKEVEELRPLINKVAQLHKENARLQQELAQASELVRKLKGKRKTVKVTGLCTC